jgi:GT2 family glycosyltransferase
MKIAGPAIVAIPVKDEEARIGACIAALGAQTRPFSQLLLLLNNCQDNSLHICRAAQHSLANIHIVERFLPKELSSAGEARRLALKYAAALAGDGVILTTDADATPDQRWIEQNVLEIENGADAVCGFPVIDPGEGALLPRGLHFDDMRETFLLSIEDEIDALVDPGPADPWPRHQQHSGASIAMRAAVLRRAGGAPHVAAGEDRALIERLRLVDARIRHAPGIAVRVSGRLVGRASGGMAEALKRRAQKSDALTDDRLEPAVDAYRRSLAKARLRAARAGQADPSLAEDLLISDGAINRALRAQYFGAAWADVQRQSPVLRRRRVPFANLANETRQALKLRETAQATARHARPNHTEQEMPRDELAG